MRKPIFFKFFTGFLIISLTLAVLILAASYRVIKTYSIRNTEQNLERIAIPLREIIAPILDKSNAPALNTIARRYAPRFDLRITIINRDGTVLGDSEKDPAALENHADRPEVIGALSGTTSRSIRYSTTFDEDLLYIAVPVPEEGRVMGVLRLSVSLRHISELMNKLVARLAGLTVLIILFSSLLSALFSHYLSTPVRAMSKAAMRIATGDLTARVTPGTDDEIRDLTEGFNEMALKLEQSFSEVKARNEELEGIVSSITELLLVLDAQGRVMLSNAAARRIILSETI
ncbi:MAG TPA: HAMP domain-containing protein, partial [Desulfomonilia bacterium]|nr:HAMP domain-containing protein [Desulfomonilia bacterium]